MSRVIYSLKYYLLQANFETETAEIKKIEDFCVFSSIFYLKYWLETPYLAEAAFNDLDFFQNLQHFGKIHKDGATAVAKKCELQSW